MALTIDDVERELGDRFTAIANATRAKNRQKKARYTLDELPEAINAIELGIPPGAWVATVRSVDSDGNELLDDVELTCDERCVVTYLAPPVEGLFPEPDQLVIAIDEDSEFTIVYTAWQYATLVDINLTSGLSPYLGILVSNGEVEVNWGDGSDPQTVVKSSNRTLLQHTYPAAGKYRIMITAAAKDASYVLTYANYADSCFVSPDYAPAVESVSLGHNVERVRAYNFKGCTSLASVDIKKTATAIESNAFYNCKLLRGFDLSDYPISEIGTYAFYGCTGITELLLPDTLTSLGGRAFQGCALLSSLDIPAGVKTLNQYTAADCSVLTSFSAPGATEVAAYVFASAAAKAPANLATAQFGSPGNPVSSINASAFAYVKAPVAITVYTVNGLESDLAGAPWGATNATINYQKA